MSDILREKESGMKISKVIERRVKSATGEISWEEIVLHVRRQFSKAVGLPKEQLNNIGVFAEKDPILGFKIKISYVEPK